MMTLGTAKTGYGPAATRSSPYFLSAGGATGSAQSGGNAQAVDLLPSAVYFYIVKIHGLRVGGEERRPHCQAWRGARRGRIRRRTRVEAVPARDRRCP